MQLDSFPILQPFGIYDSEKHYKDYVGIENCSRAMEKKAISQSIIALKRKINDLFIISI